MTDTSPRIAWLDAEVIASLPSAYVVTLQAVAAGEDDATLAERLGVELAAVPALVRIATAKLLEVQRAQRRG